MNNKTVTSPEDFLNNIEETMYDYFTFPILKSTIKYRRPDMLKLAFNNSLPAAMASAIIKAYKEAIGGADMENYADEATKDKIKPDEDLVKDLSEKGYVLLKELCVTYKILNVPQSDVTQGVVSWSDIPEEDAMAFLLNLIQKAQIAHTKTGGEVSTGDIETFPVSKRRSKRAIAGTDGEVIREQA